MVHNKDGVIEIDLMEVLNAFIKKAWLVVLCVIIFAICGFAYAFYGIAPTYKSSVMFYVNNNTARNEYDMTKLNISSADISAAKSLVDTYAVILKTRNTLNEVIARSGEDIDYRKLSGMVSAAAVNETEVFQVTVTSRDPLQAEHLANTIADVLPEKIASIVEGSSARVVDYAVIPTMKSAPSLKKYALTGALIGFVVAAVIIILMLLLDYQIHTEDYLINTYPEIPLLGVIPDFDMRRTYGKYLRYGRKGKYGYYKNNYYYSTDTDDTGDKSTGGDTGASGQTDETLKPGRTRKKRNRLTVKKVERSVSQER
ncbi:MAG: hypothetical protein KBS51_03530 [Lachnospiraceae bacterium]|nr:hypothetical protein [Candidatus Darwinimomas equi]